MWDADSAASSHAKRTKVQSADLRTDVVHPLNAEMVLIGGSNEALQLEASWSKVQQSRTNSFWLTATAELPVLTG
jgi:hypothetical protein